jgi:hypothetical protein
MNKLAFIFLCAMMVSFSIADENDKIIRSRRDGNVMMTGCKEFDKFVQNLSNFGKKIVAMFKSKDNDITIEDKNVNKENDMNTDDDANNMEETIDGNNPQGVQEDIIIVSKLNDGNAGDTGDLIHMDFLPIN